MVAVVEGHDLLVHLHPAHLDQVVGVQAGQAGLQDQGQPDKVIMVELRQRALLIMVVAVAVEHRKLGAMALPRPAVMEVPALRHL